MLKVISKIVTQNDHNYRKKDRIHERSGNFHLHFTVCHLPKRTSQNIGIEWIPNTHNNATRQSPLRLFCGHSVSFQNFVIFKEASESLFKVQFSMNLNQLNTSKIDNKGQSLMIEEGTRKLGFFKKRCFTTFYNMSSRGKFHIKSLMIFTVTKIVSEI